MKYPPVLLIALICILNAPLSAVPLTVDGKPAGEFVLPAAPHPAETFATQDVQHWIEQITGAKVPMLNAPSPTANIKILVGTALAKDFADDLAKLQNTDGYAIRRRDNRIYVFGSRPRGTMYGLYAFLEKNTDLIFARPDPDFGTIHGKTPTLELTQTDVLDIPVFRIRQLGPDWPKHRPTGIWLLRNTDNRRDHRASYKGFLELDLQEQYGTNFAVPIARHAEAHPEYFGWNPVSQSRRFVKHGEGTMCLSVPDLPAIWAQGLADDVARHEARVGQKVEFVRLGPGDNWFCCQCDKCLEPLQLPDGTTLACKDPDSIKDPLFRSTQIMMFINKAMETWQKLRPEVRIHVLAYIHFAEPPLVSVHPELGIWYAPYPTNNMHYPLLDPRQPEPWGRRFKQWLTMTPRLGFYEYFEAKPTPQAFYVAANLREVIKLPDHANAIIYAEINNDFGSKGLAHGALGWDVGLMNHWVALRLFWDPNQDVDELYRYFIRRTYREAAPQMLAYYDMIKKSWFDPKNKTVTACHTSIANAYKGLIVTPGLEKECFRLLDEAEKNAQHPNSKIIIQRMKTQYAGFSKELARLEIARIPEIRTDDGDFDSLQWEKPWPNDDFRVDSLTGEPSAAPEATAFKAAHDGKTLYLKFTASDHDMDRQKATMPTPGQERWPGDDHIELWLFQGRDSHVFAFNANGVQYDAKNLDRSWNADWTLRTRKTDAGWEAIASMPLSTFKFASGQPTSWKWFCTRTISRTDGSTHELSYQGLPLYRLDFPIVVE